MRLAEKESCTGCGACVNACPVDVLCLKRDENGFYTPQMVGTCIDCGQCARACPILSKCGGTPGFKGAYAAYTVDEESRSASSSGGVFSVLADNVLTRGGAVFGAAYADGFSVSHICVEHSDALARLRGAKYVQSDIGFCFREIKQKLDCGQPVLFSGTPCQVAGLTAFLGRDYDHLLLVDLVCHSVPSPNAWMGYVRYRAAKDNNGILPEMINLRSKHTGWSNYSYSNLYEYRDGTAYSSRSGDDPFMRLFVGGCISREACASCRFKGLERVSDMTLGDFWGVWEVCPDMDDNRGTSLLLVHSEKGAEILKTIQPELRMKPVDAEVACSFNPAVFRSFPLDARRSRMLALAAAGEYDAALREFDAPRKSLLKKIWKMIK